VFRKRQIIKPENWAKISLARFYILTVIGAKERTWCRNHIKPSKTTAIDIPGCNSSVGEKRKSSIHRVKLQDGEIESEID
jgi:hypothetical protein